VRSFGASAHRSTLRTAGGASEGPMSRNPRDMGSPCQRESSVRLNGYGLGPRGEILQPGPKPPPSGRGGRLECPPPKSTEGGQPRQGQG
jgi:hypothetical protein